MCVITDFNTRFKTLYSNEVRFIFLLSPLERAKERDCIFYVLITRMYQIIISAIDDCQNSSADDQSNSDNYLKFNIVIFIVEIFTS